MKVSGLPGIYSLRGLLPENVPAELPFAASKENGQLVATPMVGSPRCRVATLLVADGPRRNRAPPSLDHPVDGPFMLYPVRLRPFRAVIAQKCGQHDSSGVYKLRGNVGSRVLDSTKF